MADEVVRRAILELLARTPFGSLGRRRVLEELLTTSALGEPGAGAAAARVPQEAMAMIADRLLAPGGDGMWRLTEAGRRAASAFGEPPAERVVEHTAPPPMVDPGSRLPSASSPARRRRPQLPPSPREGAVWTLQPGEHMSRDERRRGYGGATYGGIEPSAQTPNVFVYSDPSRGQRNGYDYDGWSLDGSVFSYTGEGRSGGQRMQSGNRDILRHREDQRSLRLFVADGTLPGSSAKDQLYLGEFEVDTAEPFTVERAPDASGRVRDVFVFRLLPIGSVLRRLQDGQTRPLATRREADGRTGVVLPLSDPAPSTAPGRLTWTAQDDERLRRELAAWLAVRSNDGERALSTAELHDFTVDGRLVPLISTTASVVAPGTLTAAVTIVTAYTPSSRERPFEDLPGGDGMLRFAWRGADPQHPENRALRRAMERGVPVVWLFGVGPTSYLPVFPVYVLAEHASQRQFVIDPDVGHGLVAAGSVVEERMRRYIIAQTRRRLHQPVFRATVMRAYAARCAVCSLGHERLLDAAHIIPDSDPLGIASVRNGLALCKIHHAALDANILGIRPDRVVQIRADLLKEVDGPMLQHGLQHHHGERLRVVPDAVSEHPDRDLLVLRYAEFQSAG